MIKWFASTQITQHQVRNGFVEVHVRSQTNEVNFVDNNNNLQSHPNEVHNLFATLLREFVNDFVKVTCEVILTMIKCRERFVDYNGLLLCCVTQN